MSHRKIFQISKKPIKKEDYITKERCDKKFIGPIVDYVSIIDDPESEYEWLGSALKGAAKLNSNKLKIVNKAAYFHKKYKDWKILLERLQRYTFEDFCWESDQRSSIDMDDFKLKEAYNDKYGFYLDDNDEYYGNQTLDTFMRNTHDGDIWYLGAIFDYHY